MHEGASVRFGSQRGLGQNVLWNTLQEGHHALILPTLCNKTFFLLQLVIQSQNMQQRMFLFLSLTVVFGFGVEDVAAPLREVGQHAEHSLNAELRQAGGRILTMPPSSFIALRQHCHHLLRYLEAEGVLLLQKKKKTALTLCKLRYRCVLTSDCCAGVQPSSM